MEWLDGELWAACEFVVKHSPKGLISGLSVIPGTLLTIPAMRAFPLAVCAVLLTLVPYLSQAPSFSWLSGSDICFGLSVSSAGGSVHSVAESVGVYAAAFILFFAAA